MVSKCPDCKTILKHHPTKDALKQYTCPGCGSIWEKYHYGDYKKIKALHHIHPPVSNRMVKKDLTQPLDRFVDWWVNYFNKEIPFKVAWNWKSEAYGMSSGTCYRDTCEVRFKRSDCERWFKRGDQKSVRDLVAHEMAHFMHKDSAHKSGKFLEYKKKWGFEKDVNDKSTRK